MSKFIELEEAARVLKRVGAPTYAINALYLVEPAYAFNPPVLRGSWKLNDDGSATCKHCGRTTKYAWDYDSVFKYCPDCGSRNG